MGHDIAPKVPMSSKSQQSIAAMLGQHAGALRDVEQGVACAGTALEARTFQVGGKAFLFLGPKDVRLKLTVSVADATSFAGRPASAVRVGANGWTTISLNAGSVPSRGVLRRWVAESHAAFRAAAKPKSAPPARRRATP